MRYSSKNALVDHLPALVPGCVVLTDVGVELSLCKSLSELLGGLKRAVHLPVAADEESASHFDECGSTEGSEGCSLGEWFGGGSDEAGAKKKKLQIGRRQHQMRVVGQRRVVPG